MLRVHKKLLGRSRAVVIDNRDPLKRGRIRVRHGLLGDTVWIDYLKGPGSYDVPNIGDIVYIEADCGEDTHPIASGTMVAGPDDGLKVPEAFQRVKPTNRGIYSPNGHLVELDDGEGLDKSGKAIRLTTSGGIKIHALETSSTESKVLIELPSGIKLEIDGESEKILAQLSSTSITLSGDDGLNVEVNDGSGNLTINNKGEIKASNDKASITLTSAGDVETVNDKASIKLASGGDITATSGQATLKVTSAGKVFLGGSAAEVVDILSQTLDKLSTTTAPGFGATISSVADFLALKTKLDNIKE